MIHKIVCWLFWPIYLFSAFAACDCLLNLYIINTDIGYNGLGAGGILVAAFAFGNLAFVIGGWRAAKRFYDSTIARIVFICSLPLIFTMVVVGASYIQQKAFSGQSGEPAMAHALIFTLLMYLWLTLELTRKN